MYYYIHKYIFKMCILTYTQKHIIFILLAAVIYIAHTTVCIFYFSFYLFYAHLYIHFLFLFYAYTTIFIFAGSICRHCYSFQLTGIYFLRFFLCVHFIYHLNFFLSFYFSILVFDIYFKFVLYIFVLFYFFTSFFCSFSVFFIFMAHLNSSLFYEVARKQRQLLEGVWAVKNVNFIYSLLPLFIF